MKHLLESIEFRVNHGTLLVNLASTHSDYASLISTALQGMKVKNVPYKDVSVTVAFDGLAVGTTADSVTDLMIPSIIDEVFRWKKTEVKLAFDISDEVMEAFAHHSKKVHMTNDVLWTRNGVISFPFDIGEGGEITIDCNAPEVDVYRNGIKIVTLEGKLSDKLNTLGHTLLDNITKESSVDAHQMQNILRVSPVIGSISLARTTIKELLTSELADSSTTIGPEDVLPGKLKNTFIPQICTPLQGFTDLWYLGEGMIGNPATGEVIAPVTIDDKVMFIITEYLGDKESTIRIPYVIAQRAMDLSTVGLSKSQMGDVANRRIVTSLTSAIPASWWN